jgi:hypothetical protein
MGCVLVMATASCKKYLDVNNDPNSPNNESVLIQNRLPWIQHFYQYTSGVSNFRTSCVAGVYYSSSGSAVGLGTTWTGTTGNTTPYQTFFVEVASNLNDLYNTAAKQNAYYYMAAANVFHAMGFMEMLDIYSEMPYTQAISGIPSPEFDDGKTIYYGCMAKLNEAINLFSKTQDPAATKLSSGDLWNSGNVDKWIKLCWGLKARYMLKLSKKADLYNPDSILYCLTKGPQSNADNIVSPGFNNSTVTDYLLGDPVVTNGNWDYAAYGSTQRISQYYYNLLTNMRGSGVTDPRMSKIVPAAMSDIKLDGSKKVISYTWNRSVGVDSYGPSTRLVKGGPASIVAAAYAVTPVTITYTITDATDRANFIAAQIASGRTYTTSGDDVKVTYNPGSIYINSTNYVFAGDTAYVNLRSSSLVTSGTTQGPLDVNWYSSPAAFAAGAVMSTGSFQVRPVSDQEILTYHEMCFIKAEVYMRKGDAANAHLAYLDGIQAHLNMMQSKLSEWQAAGYASNNPDMAPMNPADISAYMTSAAVAQSSGTLTMSDIMLQKYLAMGCSIENWNDMRRFNFSAGNIGTFGVIYPGYDRGPLFGGAAFYPTNVKTEPRYWQRRWNLPTNLELNYNINNVLAMNKHATEPSNWSIPVWWDCATDAEYNNYLKN